MNEDYVKYVKSDRWKHKCALFFQTYGKRCAICGTGRGPIQVHHITYDRLGRELLSDLRGLCTKHHLALHAAHRKARRPNLMMFSLRYIEQEKKKGTRKP